MQNEYGYLQDTYVYIKIGSCDIDENGNYSLNTQDKDRMKKNGFSDKQIQELGEKAQYCNEQGGSHVVCWPEWGPGGTCCLTCTCDNFIYLDKYGNPNFGGTDNDGNNPVSKICP